MTSLPPSQATCAHSRLAPAARSGKGKNAKKKNIHHLWMSFLPFQHAMELTGTKGKPWWEELNQELRKWKGKCLYLEKRKKNAKRQIKKGERERVRGWGIEIIWKDACHVRKTQSIAFHSLWSMQQGWMFHSLLIRLKWTKAAPISVIDRTLPISPIAFISKIKQTVRYEMIVQVQENTEFETCLLTAREEILLKIQW